MRYNESTNYFSDYLKEQTIIFPFSCDHNLVCSHQSVFPYKYYLYIHLRATIAVKIRSYKSKFQFGDSFFSVYSEEDQQKKEDVESGPEEEEVPTRGYLKRQANLIVDAKSRSKRGNRRR